MSWYKSLKNGAIGTIGGALLGGPVGAQIGGAIGGLSGSDNSSIKSGLAAGKEWLLGGGATKGLNTTGENSGFAGGIMRGQLEQLQGRAAPTAQAAQLGQAAQLNTGQADQVRAQQQATAGYLQGIMGGTQAGAGELAVNRQVGQANAAQTAMARVARGANAALAARQAARSQADIGLAGAGQAAQAQMGDQAQAVGQLGGILAQTRGQDLDVAGQNAQFQQQRMMGQGSMDQQAALANLTAQLQSRGMNDQAIQGYLAQMTGLDRDAWQRELQKRALAQGDKGALPGILQAAGSAATTYATGGFGGGKLLGAG